MSAVMTAHGAADATHRSTLVIGCARCGGTHEGLSVFASDSADWPHYALCPVTGEPVLFRS